MDNDILGRIAGWCLADPKLTYLEEGPAIEVAGEPPRRLELALTEEQVLLSHRVSLPAAGEDHLAEALNLVNRRGSLLRGTAELEHGGLVVGIEYPLYLDGLTRQSFLLAVQEVAGAADAADALEAGTAAEAPAVVMPETPATAEPEIIFEPAAAPMVADTIELPAAGRRTAAPFLATHEVPAGGMSAWAKPDPSLPSIARLEARVQLRVDERRGAWARVTGSNGWSGWVDDRRLVARAEAPTMAAVAAVPTSAAPAFTAPVVAPAATAVQPGVWLATHQVPAGGMPAWAGPDPAAAPVAQLAARTQLRVEETRGAWARVTGSNGWSGWVDARRLTGLGAGPAVGAAAFGQPGSGLRFNPILLIGGLLVGVTTFMDWYRWGFTTWDLPQLHPWNDPTAIAAVFIAIGAIIAAFSAKKAAAAVGLLGAAILGAWISIIARGAPTLGTFFKQTRGGWLFMAGALLLLIGGVVSASAKD